jgi:hypothetical protein
MKISTDKLLVLKAFYLGNRIREASEFKDAAVIMVNYAILSLQKEIGLKNETRKLFYYLILCELLRDNQNVIKYRLIAMNLASTLGKENIYSDYMTIVNATDSKLKVYGINKGFFYKQPIASRERSLSGDAVFEWDIDTYWRDPSELPFPAIGINFYDLTESQADYINLGTLKDVMSADNINYH